MNFADNLKKIRKDNNLSQEQLAEKLGISRQAVSKWESGQSYPEMDKVVQICQLFDVNMDELINEDITKTKEKKDDVSNTNKYIKSFFDYITKVVDMFSSMKFKQILLCLIEQFIIILFIIGFMAIIGGIGSSLVSDMIMILPDNVYYIVYHILESIFIIIGTIICTVIYLHIFKVRYLDYYEIVKVEDKDKEEDKDVEENEIDEDNDKTIENKKDKGKNTIYLEKRPEKVIIRDPEHSEFSFISGMAKCILWLIKFVAFFFMIGTAFALILFTMGFAMSFVIIKSGFLFWGLILTFIGCIAITSIILELFYDFIFDRKINKTKIFIVGMISLLLIGFGIGSSIISFNNFEYVEKDVELVKDNYTFEMKDNLYFEYTYWYNDSWNIEYIEKNIDNVEMVVEHSKYSNIEYNFDEVDLSISVFLHSSEEETYNIVKEIIKGLNDKKIYNYNFDSKIIIYANKDNIVKLKQNYNFHRSRVNYLEKQINELEEENNILEKFISSKNNIRIERDRAGHIIGVYEIKDEYNEE